MTQQPVIFIDGEAGTTGLGIRDRLSALPVRIHSIDHTRRKDPAARKDAMAAADLVVLCLPDDASREAVAIAETLGENAPRILDASTAFRTRPAGSMVFRNFLPHRARPFRLPPAFQTPAAILREP